jgi:hypothetical protein
MEEKSNPQIWRSCLNTATQVAGDWRGRGLRGSAYVVWPIWKDLVVMSQWAHCPWNLESLEAAPVWPVAMAAQPAKQKEASGRCPCLLWKTSQLIGSREMGLVEHEHMGDLSISRLGDSILRDLPKLPCPTVFSVHRSLCHLAWISLHRTGCPGPHCGTKAALISDSHPDYLISGVVLVDWQGRDEIMRRHRSWFDITSPLGCRVH